MVDLISDVPQSYWMLLWSGCGSSNLVLDGFNIRGKKEE